MGPIYVVDTSALIGAWVRKYPLENFPGFWEKVEGLISGKRMVAPDEVLRELEAKEGDTLHKWAKARAEHTIHGFRNKDLRRRLPFDAGRVSRLLKRLRVHGLIKRVGRTYKYYLTTLGRRAILAGLHIRTMILPQMLTADC